ncbi:MAG: helix-turn-helix domain-containing protein [Thermocrispum sp.]
MNVEKRQLEFGETLLRLRVKAGYTTGKDFAEAIGWQASKVSRIENGRTLPALADVEAWFSAVDAPAEVAEQIRDDMREIRLARDSWKRQLRHGHATRQRIEARAERSAARITSVEMFILPGLVQTAEYARAVFAMSAAQHATPPDTEEAVRERIRRQEVLYDPDKQIEVLVHELALRPPFVGAAAVMRAQLDRMATLGGLTNLRFGVIPIDAVLPTVTMHGYTIHDDTVVVEINHTEVATADPDDLALYRRITDQLWSVAAEGDDARAILARLLA